MKVNVSSNNESKPNKKHNGSPNPSQKTIPHNNQQQKKKKKEKASEKKDKYLDLARELKKLWNMKVKIVPIVIGALGTITKGLSLCFV